MIGKLLGAFSCDIGIDLGTANTLVYVRDHGIVLREPSVVAVKTGTNFVLAVGDDAKRMLGRTPQNIGALRPLRDGVVADYEATEAMLRHFIRKVHRRHRWIRPRVVVAVPSGITEVEKRAVNESAAAAGAREIHLIEQPMAAAIGAGLPVQEAAANLVVDIGAGTTEIAILSLYGLVYGRSVRVAGDEFDEAVTDYLRRACGLVVGERTAEEVKIRMGSAAPLEKERRVEVKGRDLSTGLPRTVSMSTEEIRAALAEPLGVILDSLRASLDRCPPDLSADLVERGVVLTGGGALLPGIDRFLSIGTGLPVHIAEDPLGSVAEGTGKLLEELDFLRKVAHSGRTH